MRIAINVLATSPIGSEVRLNFLFHRDEVTRADDQPLDDFHRQALDEIAAVVGRYLAVYDHEVVASLAAVSVITDLFLYVPYTQESVVFSLDRGLLVCRDQTLSANILVLGYLKALLAAINPGAIKTDPLADLAEAPRPT